MAAQSKSELLEITLKEFAKLEKTVGPITAEIAMRKDDDDTSVKDVVAHRAHWIDLFRGWYADGMAGKQVFFPAEGYKWNELKRYNAELRLRQAGMSWSDALGGLRESHDKLVMFINQCSNEDLYSGPMKGANNSWTPGRWAEAAGASHYRSATKYIRSRLKTDL